MILATRSARQFEERVIHTSRIALHAASAMQHARRSMGKSDAIVARITELLLIAGFGRKGTCPIVDSGCRTPPRFGGPNGVGPQGFPLFVAW